MTQKFIYNLHANPGKLPITSHCPKCGYGPLNGASAVEALSEEDARKNLGDLIDPPATKPQEGWVSVCGRCKALLIFATIGGQLGLRALNRRELVKIKKQPKVWAVVQLLRRCRR